MSAKDRLERDYRQKEERGARLMREGMRQCLESPDGRALLSWIIHTALESEGKGSTQLRMFGRDILGAARHANWEGVQIMRNEWEKPGAIPKQDEEEPEE